LTDQIGPTKPDTRINIPSQQRECWSLVAPRMRMLKHVALVVAVVEVET